MSREDYYRSWKKLCDLGYNFNMTELQPVSQWITSPLLEKIRSNYCLPWDGIHGYAHWSRVRENGLRIAGLNGANKRIVEYFAFCHDSCRRNENHDPAHGHRAGSYIRKELLPYLDLSQEELELLCFACNLHTDGFTQGDITIQTCWDADRLDLMRVGIMPHCKYLCTNEAKQQEIMDWAVKNSLEWCESIDL